MPIVLVRIDDRLVHGQIVEGWVKIIRANHIVVVSDEVARDKMQQALFSIAVPASIKVSTFAVEEAARKIKENALGADRLLVLFSNPQDIVRFIGFGVTLPSVNIGGMHFTPGKRQVFRTLSVDDKDIAAFAELIKLNVELEGRILPDDERIDITGIIQKEIERDKNAGAPPDQAQA